MKSKETEIPWWIWLLAIVLFLVVVIVFVASLGSLDIEKKLPDEFKDSKAKAIERRNFLFQELQNKISLKNKLDKRFKWTYFLVRVILVTTSTTTIFYFGKFMGALTIADFLTYYQFAIIILLVMNFIAFGTIANLNDFIILLKLRIENWIWSKYVDLKFEIEMLKTEINTVQIEISSTVQETVTVISNEVDVKQLSEGIERQ